VLHLTAPTVVDSAGSDQQSVRPLLLPVCSVGTDNMGRRVCTSCHDNHILIPGGIECRRRVTTVWNGK
jgi:hypothetical protein